MKKRNLFLSLAVGAMAMGCNSGSLDQTSAPLSSTADTANFYLGYMMGTSVKNMKLETVNMNALVAGMNTALKDKKMDLTPQEIDMYLNNYFRNIMIRRSEENAAKGKKFLEENAKKAGVDTLSNGIQYKVIKKGEGEKPSVTDVVKVHYKGTLLDGTEFDSSYKRNKPATFPLNQVIPGWTIALQAMPVGSKWIIYIPSNMAYGQRGGGPIGPNETLTFEVELLEIVKDEAKEEAKDKE